VFHVGVLQTTPPSPDAATSGRTHSIRFSIVPLK
jgi:hypothetical protein